jgi:homeobox-leucine zipper protein
MQLDRVSGLTSKYLGRPITQLPPVHPLSIASLDLTVGGLGSPSVGPSLDLDLLTGGTPSMPFSFPTGVSDMEKPIMAEMATAAMDELVRLAQSNEPLWVKQGDGREVLSFDAYDSMFPKPGSRFRGPDIRAEASRDSALVFMNAVSLVDMFLDSVSFFFLHSTGYKICDASIFGLYCPLWCRASGLSSSLPLLPRPGQLIYLQMEWLGGAAPCSW